ncbi:MAG: isochorismatase family protein [Acidimicrobiales bacterium]
MDRETTASYADAGFGQTVPFGERPAVLVVDMCRAYFEPTSPLFLNRPGVADATTELVAAARAAGVPVVWTRVEYEPGGADGGIWYQKIPALSSFDRGNPLADWLEGLVPESADLVVTKKHASGFAGTDLAEQLRSLDIDTVVIGGVSTSGCVRATATDASAAGLVPFVVRDAVGDRTDAVQRSNLFDLHAKYADVISLETALHELTTSI